MKKASSWPATSSELQRQGLALAHLGHQRQYLLLRDRTNISVERQL